MPHETDAKKIVRPLRSGEITIPAAFRKQLGIDEQSLLQMSITDGELRIKPGAVREVTQGSLWLRDLYNYFAPVREEAQAKGYSEDEINDAIDAAVSAVRASQRARNVCLISCSTCSGWVVGSV